MPTACPALVEGLALGPPHLVLKKLQLNPASFGNYSGVVVVPAPAGDGLLKAILSELVIKKRRHMRRAYRQNVVDYTLFMFLSFAGRWFLKATLVKLVLKKA